MMSINLIKDLEKISARFSDKILILKGFIRINNHNEILEIIIYKGFSSSTTHNIEIDPEKNVVDFECSFTKCDLMQAPLSYSKESIIKSTKNIYLFLNEKFWF